MSLKSFPSLSVASTAIEIVIGVVHNIGGGTNADVKINETEKVGHADTSSSAARRSSATPIGVLGRPRESRNSALRRTSTATPCWSAMLAMIAESLAQQSAWLSAR
jgi:hypothetical protein